MAKAMSTTSFGGITSDTWYSAPPVEWGRAGAAVASVTVEGLGTSSIINITKQEVKRRFLKVSGGPGRI